MSLLPRPYLLRLSAALLGTTAAGFGCATPCEQSFSCPEDAVVEMRDLIGTCDERRAEEVFGPNCVERLEADDVVAEVDDAYRVKAMIDQRVSFVYVEPDYAIAVVGNEEWPVPIPLVQDEDGTWRFDTAAGAEELRNRRIGENELDTIATLNELVLAQREFRDATPEGEPATYAPRFWSDAGKRNGLYWEDADSETTCPIGIELARADCTLRDIDAPNQPIPFQGYFYRVLTRKAHYAASGEPTLLDDDRMLVHGYGILAWPASYDETGVMTFMVNQRGIVYEKDLGPLTEKLVSEIVEFEPDPSWSPASP